MAQLHKPNVSSLSAIAILLMGLVLGCGQSQVSQNSLNVERQATPNETPKAIFDLKAVMGKPVREVERVLGEPKNRDKLIPKPSFDYDLSIDYSWGHINFRNDKAKYVHFESPTGYDNFFPLGKEVGVNLVGVEPTFSNDYMIMYKNTSISGMKFSEVRVVPGNDKAYGILTFKLD